MQQYFHQQVEEAIVTQAFDNAILSAVTLAVRVNRFSDGIAKFEYDIAELKDRLEAFEAYHMEKGGVVESTENEPVEVKAEDMIGNDSGHQVQIKQEHAHTPNRQEASGLELQGAAPEQDDVDMDIGRNDSGHALVRNLWSPSDYDGALSR